MTMKKLLTHCLAMGIIIAAWIACILVFATLMGCKPQERVVYQTRTDSVFFAVTDTFTKFVEVVKHDTVQERDSVILREFVTLKVNEGGDTIWRDRVVYRDRWHDGKQSATVLSDSKTDSKTDNVVVEVRSDTVYVKETVKEKKGFAERVKDAAVWIGVFAVLAVVFFIVRWIRK